MPSPKNSSIPARVSDATSQLAVAEVGLTVRGRELMRNNVWIFLPLLLYGVAVLLALFLCYFVAPQNKRKRRIHFKSKAQNTKPFAWTRPESVQRPLRNEQTKNSRPDDVNPAITNNDQYIKLIYLNTPGRETCKARRR